MLLLGCALAVAVLAVAVLSLGGLTVPLLAQQQAEGGGSMRVADDLGRPTGVGFEARLRFVNEGWFPVTVTGVGLRADGLRLLSVQADGGHPFPHTIPAGGSVVLSLTMEITDCASAATSRAPVEFQVARWWGTVTGTAERQSLFPEEPWQNFQVSVVCRQ
jgi:hypothetical protein